MTHQQALEKCLKACFADRFTAADMATPLSALDVDSLDLMEFVMAVEEEFDIAIEADRVDLGKGLDQFAALVGELAPAGTAG
ncbi:MAG: phosphopantetheine-binding protein [Silicimonas sp.]|jgi:acyl carrier protein|nr:phosphopantetheine-binding protein [Silicimonas sp.]